MHFRWRNLALVFFILQHGPTIESIAQSSIPKGYPPTALSTPVERERKLLLWKHFVERYKIDQQEPVFDSLLLVPMDGAIHDINIRQKKYRSFGAQQGRREKLDREKRNFRDLLSFIDEWKDMFNVSSSELKLQSTSKSTRPTTDYIFILKKEFPYGHDVVGTGFGTSSPNEIWASVGENGILRRISSTCAPTLQFSPFDPIVSRDSAERRLEGKEYIRPKGLTPDTSVEREHIKTGNIQSATLMIVIVPTHDTQDKGRPFGLEYRTAWKLNLDPNCLSDFVDAITGEDLGFYDPCIY
ncbi:MAG: hypothetical protein HY033_03460 [Ignavibacteriae bacterium]|nr:hypothetical protein [Ignavibacteria bacterium]MBI3363947.1 hypothetical protein [Ignavibacteriota bacterium]